MRAADATKHQTASTWTIEVLTVLLSTLALLHYLLETLATTAAAAIISLSLFIVSLAAVRTYFVFAAFGGVTW